MRRSEDAYVDTLVRRRARLWRAAVARALSPAPISIPNREPYEFDPTMFEDALPAYVNRNSPRVKMGLGTIARVVASGEEIYARKLWPTRRLSGSSGSTGPITAR